MCALKHMHIHTDTQNFSGLGEACFREIHTKAYQNSVLRNVQMGKFYNLMSKDHTIV